MKRISHRKVKGGLITWFRRAGILPPHARHLLQKVGSQQIYSLSLVKTPVESNVKTLMNLISLGRYEDAVKGAKYDSMFHLALFINNHFTLDKQEVIKFVGRSPITRQSHVMDVPLVGGLVTINELLENTKRLMGPERFTSYNARTNNCQDFVLSVLTANNLLSKEARDFIKQDAEAVFRNMPSFTGRTAKFFTDVGASVNRLIEGEGQ